MKKILTLTSLVLCISLLCCMLFSCGGSEKSEQVSEEQWNNAMNISTNLTAKFVEAYEENDYGEIYKEKTTADVTYQDGVLTANFVDEYTEYGETERTTDSDTSTVEGLTVGKLIYDYTEIGGYLFETLSYNDFKYSGDCYIYTKSENNSNIEIIVFILWG